MEVKATGAVENRTCLSLGEARLETSPMAGIPDSRES